jgi:hypothetical protein
VGKEKTKVFPFVSEVFYFKTFDLGGLDGNTFHSNYLIGSTAPIKDVLIKMPLNRNALGICKGCGRGEQVLNLKDRCQNCWLAGQPIAYQQKIMSREWVLNRLL